MNRYQPKGTLGRSAVEHLESLKKGEYTAEELAKQALAHAKSVESLHIFLSLDEERILKQAKESDARRKAGKAGPLEGIPVSIKDNICEDGEQVTCASKFLKNYRSPYSATVIHKLKEAGAVLLACSNHGRPGMSAGAALSFSQPTGGP